MVYMDIEIRQLNDKSGYYVKTDFGSFDFATKKAAKAFIKSIQSC